MGAFLPRLTAPATQSLFTSAFGGYNHHEVIRDGELYDEKNMSARAYPALTTRKLRGKVTTYEQPLGMISKAALVTIDGEHVLFSDHEVTGITVSTDESMLPKQIVSMGAYVCIFPDNVYFNSIDLSDYGHMGAKWEQLGIVSLSLCRSDGTVLNETTDYVISATAPEEPTNGMLWVDTSVTPHALKVYAASTNQWTGMATVYVRISATGIGTAFKRDDAVFISGITCPEQYQGTDIEEQLKAFNECMTLYQVSNDYLVVAGILDRVVNIQEGGSVKVERKIPKLDYVVECNNRIWGCVYGLVDGQTLNEIHCCALGDFRNWYQYAGLSTDSYTASCGTDGPFTGAAVLKNSPVFFKESCLHRVSGVAPSNFRIEPTMCRGIQAGSWRSAVVVGESLFYKARNAIMAYDGSLPVSMSDALGDVVYYDAVAGAHNDMLYISMRDAENNWHLFTYDSPKGIWHKEDGLHALCMAAMEDELYCIDADTGDLIAMFGTRGEKENVKDLKYEVTLGKYGFDAERQKYLYRYNLRLLLTKGCRLTIWIEYDSNGEWLEAGHVYMKETGSAMIPIIPRRCDHCRIRMAGTGEFTLYSIGRTYKGGSDHSHHF